ncbi:RDHE2 dehydrogenase, partial [Polypterus senegalus]
MWTLWWTAGAHTQLGRLEHGRTERGVIPPLEHKKAATLVGVEATGTELGSSTLWGPVAIARGCLDGSEAMVCSISTTPGSAAGPEGSKLSPPSIWLVPVRSVKSFYIGQPRSASALPATWSVKREVGDVTILINNAGIVTGKKFMDSPDDLVQKTLEVNTLAHFWTYKAFLPAMMASNHGHLVSIASSAGLIGVNGLADYCASKFAAVGFAESIGLEMLASGKDGIKTTIVCPYFITTGMFDGCQTKWPRLLPILDSSYAAKKIVDAILKEQVYLVMPRSLYFVFGLKNIVPVKLGLLLGVYFGAFNFMDHFKGRRKND